MPFSTIILAAGQGVRMHSNLPKVMHKVASLPMIDYVLSTVLKLKPKENILVVGSNMETLKDYAKNKVPSIKFALQDAVRGTADAVKVGIKELQEREQDVLILYGDVPFVTSETITDMRATLRENYPRTALVVLGFIAKDPAHYGRLIIDGHGHLDKIVEFIDCNDKEKKIDVCNSGIMMINKMHLTKLLSKVKKNETKGEFYLTDLVDIANNNKLICKYLVVDESETTAVNNRVDLAKAEGTIQAKLRKEFLSKGVTLTDPDTVYFSGDTEIENDVTIHPNVFIGPGVTIASGVQVRSFSHIEDATIAKDVIIGPFARIRPGTELGKESLIGSFVEIKNSKIASGCKISHLSYVGDAELGKNVNVGAGAITCNYDGVSKHKTIIGDNVFIGSNSALIAPISIESNAFIGAGSVITKKVAEGELAIERGEQQNIKNGGKCLIEKKLKRKNTKPTLL